MLIAVELEQGSWDIRHRGKSLLPLEKTKDAAIEAGTRHLRDEFGEIVPLSRHPAILRGMKD